MDLRHTGSNILVSIETQSLELTIKGSAYHPSFPGVEIQEKESNLTVVCKDDFDIGLNGDAEIHTSSILGSVYTAEYSLRPLFFEQQNYELFIEPKEGHTVSFWHENHSIRKSVGPIGRDGRMLSGILNFRNDIGLSDLIVIVDGSRYLTVTLEVFPSKISYKNDYRAIVTDVTAEVYNLIFDFLKKTYEAFDTGGSTSASPVEFFAIIRKIYKEFVSAADMIIRNPYHVLQTDHVIKPGYKVKRTDSKSIRWLEKHPEQVKKTEKGLLVNKVPEVHKYITYDTKENRLAKYMLLTTAQRLEDFKRLYNVQSRTPDAVILKEIDRMIKGINRRTHTGVLAEVNANAGNTGMSLVFGMAPGYRELYRCYLLLQRGLSLTGSLFHLSVKNIAVLYEYWCFIKLNSLMKQRYELISQDIIRINGTQLTVALEKGQRSRVKYRNPHNGEIITLSFNPMIKDLPTGTQRPDNVLNLTKNGSGTNYEYVFDAKYRINPALPETDYYLGVSHHPGPEVSDINTMHRYRDAIVYKSNASRYERTMFGAYVLFPYHDEEEYKNHRFYKSIGTVNIGGLPFLPSATQLVTEMLDELISDSAETAFERATLPRGIEEKLAKVDWSKRDVLVASVKSIQERDDVLTTGYFDVLCSRIPDEKLPIRYVALYESKSVFGADAKIEHYGEVKRTDIIKKTGQNGEESYYRYTINYWKRLSKPIEPKERSFVTMFTNLFLLEHSAQVPELFLQSEEEYRFFTELKRRTEATVINDENENVGFAVNDINVAFENGDILVMNGDKIVETCPVKDFSRAPGSTFKRIMKYLSGL